MQFRSKRYKHCATTQIAEKVDLAAAIEKVKQWGNTKFNQSVEIVMNLGIDTKQADQAIRGAISLPHGIGRTLRVIAFCEGDDETKAKAAGAVEAGGDELIDKVTKGWFDFDVAIAHPKLMGKVGKLGRVLGPQGKMPTPKSGTVTPQIEQAVREFAAGKVEFRNDTGGNVHAVVGKVDFATAQLLDNINAFVDQIRRMKPAATKGVYIKKVCLSATMSPSVLVDIV